MLLEALGKLTGDDLLVEYTRKWNMESLSGSERAEIYLMFLFSKNLCRLRNRTWQLTRAKLHALASEQANRLAYAPVVPATTSLPATGYSAPRA